MLSGEWATGGRMWIKDGSDTICLFGCIESDSLENTTWQHFSKLSFQVKTLPILKLISLAPETVSLATHNSIPGLLSKYQSIFDFLPGLQRALWPQTHFWPTESAPWILFGCVHCLPGDLLPLSSPLPPGSPSSAQFTFSDSQNKVGSWEYDQNPVNWKINKQKSDL